MNPNRDLDSLEINFHVDWSGPLRTMALPFIQERLHVNKDGVLGEILDLIYH